MKEKSLVELSKEPAKEIYKQLPAAFVELGTRWTKEGAVRIHPDLIMPQLSLIFTGTNSTTSSGKL